jgi:hypothetical protein
MKGQRLAWALRDAARFIEDRLPDAQFEERLDLTLAHPADRLAHDDLAERMTRDGRFLVTTDTGALAATHLFDELRVTLCLPDVHKPGEPIGFVATGAREDCHHHRVTKECYECNPGEPIGFVAPILAGCRWESAQDNPDVCFLVSENNETIGRVARHVAEGNWRATLLCNAGGALVWSRGETAYPAKADAMRALEEIAHTLFVVGGRLRWK